MVQSVGSHNAIHNLILIYFKPQSSVQLTVILLLFYLYRERQ